MKTKRMGVIISFLIAVALFSMMNITTAKAACAHIATGTWEDSKTNPPTCCSKGKQVMKCGKCGTVLQEKEGTLKSHKWKKDSVVKDATCTKYGTTKYRCQLQCNGQPCHATKTKDDIQPLGHSASGSYVTIKAATCTKDGEKGRRCSRCSEYVEKTKIDKLGHNLKRMTTKEATCCGAGEKADVCQRKNCTHKENVETIEQKSHKWAKDSVVKKATCTEKGMTQYRCQLQCNGQPCHATKTEKDIQPLGHSASGSYTTIKAATCTKDGEEGRRCSRCSEYVEKKKIDKLGHNLKTVVTKEATCENDGEKYKKCTRSGCGYKSDIIKINALHHDMATYKTTVKSPTCTKPGLQARFCKRKGCTHKTEEETIPACGHILDGGTVIQSVSCTEPEKTKYCCKRTVNGEKCTYSETKITKEKLGHKYGKWIYPENASCVYGYDKTRVCSSCGHTEREHIEGHTYGAWQPVNKNHLPCEEYTKYQECMNPHCLQKNYSTPGYKFQDKEHEGVWETVREARCDAPGEDVKKCKYCKKTIATRKTTKEHEWYYDDFNKDLAFHPASELLTGHFFLSCKSCDKDQFVIVPRLANKLEKSDYRDWEDYVLDEIIDYYDSKKDYYSNKKDKNSKYEDFLTDVNRVLNKEKNGNYGENINELVDFDTFSIVGPNDDALKVAIGKQKADNETAAKWLMLKCGTAALELAVEAIPVIGNAVATANNVNEFAGDVIEASKCVDSLWSDTKYPEGYMDKAIRAGKHLKGFWTSDEYSDEERESVLENPRHYFYYEGTSQNRFENENPREGDYVVTFRILLNAEGYFEIYDNDYNFGVRYGSDEYYPYVEVKAILTIPKNEKERKLKYIFIKEVFDLDHYYTKSQYN